MINTLKSLNSLLCIFWKTHSSRLVLFKILQGLKKELDKSGFGVRILMDLSKFFYCLTHDVLFAKRIAHSIDKTGLNLVQSTYQIVNSGQK